MRVIRPVLTDIDVANLAFALGVAAGERPDANEAFLELAERIGQLPKIDIECPYAPTGSRVVVKPDPVKEKIGNFYLPDQSKEKPVKGTVVAVGPGSYSRSGYLVPPCVQVGDVVVYNTFVGKDVEHEGEEFMILNDRDIIAIAYGDAIDLTPDVIQSMVDQGIVNK